VRLATLTLAAVLIPSSALAQWVRVETPNFIVYSESGEKRAREIAAEFERFREALGRVIPRANVNAAVPTLAVVFGSQKSFDTYRPRFNGKPIRVAGYFYATEDLNVVAMVDSFEATRTIFHEYVHLVLDNSVGRTPLWLNEGLAEYYSTFTIEGAGRRASVGNPIVPHLQTMMEGRMLSLAELLAVEHSSPLYNEGERRRGLFYAQSWALVHMIVSRSGGFAQLNRYAALAAAGTPSLAAWREVFKEDNVTERLEQYVYRPDFIKGTQVTFERSLPQVRGEISNVSDGDVQATLGELLRRVAPAAETGAHLTRALALQPPSPHARSVLGLFELSEGRTSESQKLLLDAARDKTDWLVQYNAATGLTRLVVGTVDANPQLIHAARAAWTAVLDARPGLANALALSAWLDSSTGADLEKSLEAVRQARQAAPGRVDYTLVESYILSRKGQYSAARELLTPLQATTSSDQIRANAKHMLDQIAGFEQAASDYLARLEGRRPAPASNPPSDPPPAPPTADTLASLSPYRRLQAGEERTEGMLERIECTATGIVLHVRVDKSITRFTSPTLDTVEIFSYRDNMRGRIGCGSRNPSDRVYVTWKPQNSERRVVALEFLPLKSG
jgi:hypothetical protein